MGRPTPIIRETKVQGQVNPKPIEQVYTYQNANEDKDKINDAINYLHLFFTTGEDGLITDSRITDIHIGSIDWLGSGGVSYSEYDPDFGTAEWDEFSKDIGEDTIMQPGTHTPMVFPTKSKFKLTPR